MLGLDNKTQTQMLSKQLQTKNNNNNNNNTINNMEQRRRQELAI